MHNGGIKSFDFHSSPRMVRFILCTLSFPRLLVFSDTLALFQVPHICKPQAQLVELSIEQFIPRGKKLKDGSMHRSPDSKKLSDVEKDIIARYFPPVKEDMWEPSLIAFPGFQTFPSRVHELPHSFRTTAMLIDVMQRVQGLPLSKANNASSLIEVQLSFSVSFFCYSYFGKQNVTFFSNYICSGGRFI